MTTPAWRASTSLRRIARPPRASSSCSTTVPESRRYFNSKKSRKPDVKGDLRDVEQKQRLVSLYHHSQSFITLENLSDHIDLEFARAPGFNSVNTRQEYRKSDLTSELDRWRTLPKNISAATARINAVSKEFMSDRDVHQPNLRRDLRLRAALYGTDVSKQVGLDLVEEMSAEDQRLEEIHNGEGNSL